MPWLGSVLPFTHTYARVFHASAHLRSAVAFYDVDTVFLFNRHRVISPDTTGLRDKHKTFGVKRSVLSC